MKRRDRALVRLSELAYRALLRVSYPAAFRTRYGRDMREMFRDRCAEAVGERGVAGLIGVWAKTVPDIARHGPAEHAGRRTPAPLAGILPGMRTDLTFALRTLKKSPGFAAVAIGTLALGIGANTAVFSVVNRVLLAELPYPDPDQITMIWRYDTPSARTSTLSYPDIRDLAAEATSFSAVGPYSPGTAIIAGESSGRRVPAAVVTQGFFDVLQVGPLLGRTIQGQDEPSGSEPVVVLGHDVWERDFGGDPRILGRVVTIDSRSMTVVGVMPPEFSFPPGAQVWTPLPPDEERNGHWLSAVGRLGTGITVTQAEAEASALISRLEADFPGRYNNNTARLVGLRDQFFGDLRPVLAVVFAAVGAVLLIGCANLANLLLARAEARRAEVAIRIALGAGRIQVIRQFMTESFVLAALGGGVGVAVAYGGTGLLGSLVPAGVPPVTAGVSVRLLVFSSALTLATSLIFGLAPALRAARVDPKANLTAEGRGGGRSRDGGRSVLVVTEVAIAVALLISAGLMVRTLSELLAVDLGFETKDVWALEVEVPVTDELPQDGANEAREALAARIVSFFTELRERTEALPGVESVGQVGMLPFSGSFWGTRTMVEGQPVLPRPERYLGSWNAVTPGYFGTMGIRITRGRAIEHRDVRGNQRVAVVSESLVGVLWPEGDPIGARITNQGPDTDEWITVVGVVEDVRNGSLVSHQPGQVYLALTQAAWSDAQLVVRTEDGPGVARGIRAILRDLNPGLSVAEIRTLDSFVELERARTRFLMRLLTVFSLVAILLAAVGTYGVIAYEVSRRTHELGVRRALGARAPEIVGLVMRRTLSLALIGVAVGLAAGWGSTRLFESLLHGVSPTDPVTFATVAMLSLSVGVAACLAPAARALRIDPAGALRES